MATVLEKPPNAKPTAAVSAVEMGSRQREISVSEFFTKNRHLLGFDNPRKALLTCVKEAVDNALDASEEAGILPDVVVKVEVAVSDGTPPPAASQATRFRVTVIDYGPGIVRQQIPPIFAKLLYGSKFHRLRMKLNGFEIEAHTVRTAARSGRPGDISTSAPAFSKACRRLMVSSRLGLPRRKFSVRAVSVNGKGRALAACTAAATRSVAWPMS